MVEQNANMALRIANRGYVLQTGEVVLSELAHELLGTEVIRRAYLGEIAPQTRNSECELASREFDV